MKALFGKWKYYHTLWALLFLAWMVSYVDRTLLTPVITWMIDNKVAFFVSAPNPYALGGLIGGLFFSGYMLMQFPSGYIGDKFGHKTVVVISILWAGVATFFTGLTGSLFMFVMLRVLTGLGEGTFYSNDRSMVAAATPPRLRAMGLGIVISGLSVGMTIALLSGSWTITWAAEAFGQDMAWRVPFFLWAGISTVVGLALLSRLRHRPPLTYEFVPRVQPNYFGALKGVVAYAVVFLIVVMAIYYLAVNASLSNVAIAILEIAAALCLMGFVVLRKGGEVRPVLKDRNLLLLYFSFIPIIWSLWFYGFWSVALIQEVAATGLLLAALTAAFNGIAGLVGYPLGGFLSDRMAASGRGRRGILMTFTALHALLVLILAGYISSGGTSLVVMSVILFVSGLFFFALQPVSHAMLAEQAPPHMRATAFGMYNLISEIGAVLSPVVSGALRDATGSWTTAIYLDGALVAVSVLFVYAVREQIVATSPATQATEA